MSATSKSSPALVVGLTILTAVFVGCERQTAGVDQDVASRSDTLYQEYLEGSLEQARQSLLATVEVVERLRPSGRASCLLFTYARLYALEKRAGNDALADAYLLKARYWYLCDRELGGETPEDAAKAVATFTAEKCVAFVDKWDKGHTNGKGPRYANTQ
jgi:hypothetical protein